MLYGKKVELSDYGRAIKQKKEFPNVPGMRARKMVEKMSKERSEKRKKKRKMEN